MSAKKRREFFVSFMEFGFQPLQLIEGLPGDGRKFSKRGRIKDQFRRGLRAPCVGTGEPVADVEQFADRRERVRRRNGTRAVHRLVAETGDDPRLVEHRLARQRP